LTDIFDKVADVIATHGFSALMGELKRGNIQKAGIKAALVKLGYDVPDGREATVLTSLVDDVVAGTVTPDAISDAFMLFELGVYTRAQVKSALGR